MDLSITLTTVQVARQLGLCRERVRLLALNGELPFVETPLGRLFDAEIVERLRRERAAARATREVSRLAAPGARVEELVR